MVFIVIIVAVAAFLFGFLLGVINEPPASPVKIKCDDSDQNTEIEKLKNEYKNFLTYDGSEQA